MNSINNFVSYCVPIATGTLNYALLHLPAIAEGGQPSQHKRNKKKRKRHD